MMTNKIRFLTALFIIQAVYMTTANVRAETPAPAPSEETVLFKIHDIIPEKDADGKVIHCNIGATFFNRTKNDLTNIVVNLSWEDEVITDTIDQEERVTREKKRANPNAVVSRYPTSALNDKNVNLSLKLPSIKTNQQVSLKAKVLTDRCFILLNDMDINVSNCGIIDSSSKGTRDCRNIFRYVSPKMAEYYQEFKEKSLEEETIEEDNALESMKKEIEEIYNDTIQTFRNITSERSLTTSLEEDENDE